MLITKFIKFWRETDEVDLDEPRKLEKISIAKNIITNWDIFIYR